MITLVCRKNGAESRVFSDGKIYREVSRQGNLVIILDDFGNQRGVIPDELSPHLVVSKRPCDLHPRGRCACTQRVVGRFETVKEEA